MPKRVEIVPLYTCNSRCRFCPSWRQATGRELSTREVIAHLSTLRHQGVLEVDFGGGEPTLRSDLLTCVRAARGMGYRTVRLLTNGWRMADKPYLRASRDAGVTDVTFSVWGWDQASHEELCSTQSSYDYLLQGIRNAKKAGLALQANIMCSSEAVGYMDTMVRNLHPFGIEDFMVHVVSEHELRDRPEVRSLVPDLFEAGQAFQKAAAVASELGSKRFRTTQLPPCVLGEFRDSYVHPRDLEMVVVTPGGVFPAETSSYEGGQTIEACYRCAWRDRCNGLRAQDVQRGIGPRVQPIA